MMPGVRTALPRLEATGGRRTARLRAVRHVTNEIRATDPN